MVTRVFSGMRPSGRLHLGNYLGALQNWVELQKTNECIYAVADIHALTTLEGAETREIKSSTEEMVLDWLAAGLDPEKSIMFVQSKVPEVLTLHTLLSMSTPLGWLLRVPTFKDRVRQMGESEENVSYGLVGYPVLQTADIILYKADAVPVGADQVPHLELAREIVRRFNRLYGDTFPEPQPKLTESPTIVGLDGVNKMSKSLGNHIEIAASDEGTMKRVRSAVTDVQRQRRTDPGRPDICNVFALHEFFNPEKRPWIREQCTTAGIGCVDCKGMLADTINDYFRPIRERRTELASRPDDVWEILADGARRAEVIARPVLAEVQERMGLPARRD